MSDRALTETEIRSVATELLNAQSNKRPIPPITKQFPGLSLHDAYAVQQKGIELRVEAGDSLIGLKMGLTSESKRQQMNLHQAIYGALTRSMEISGNSFSISAGIHPRIEPEIAFYIAKDLKGAITRDEAFDACEWASAAFEIIDSRYENFKYFSLPDVIADNCSSGFFKLGAERLHPRSIDLSNLVMSMEVDGTPTQVASSKEISGDPILSVVQLCDLLHADKKILPAGSIVLAGAATPAVPLEAGQTARLKVQSLGEIILEIL